VSADGELICPDCLAAMSRREIDSEAMDMAAEALGFGSHEHLGGSARDW